MLKHFSQEVIAAFGSISHGKWAILAYLLQHTYQLTFPTGHWETHGQIYLEKCEGLKIEPNPNKLPTATKDATKTDLVQLSIDSFVKSVPKWSKEGLLEHIVDFVVSGDQVLVEHVLVIVLTSF